MIEMNEVNGELRGKYEQLKELLISYGSVCVAYSSGVDSTLLVYVAKEVLGGRMIAATATSACFPERELNEATAFCKEHNIPQVIVFANELEIKGFAQNPPNRCYICKKDLFRKFLEVADCHNLETVVEGSNMDDMGDFRPGMLAIKELGIKSPLKEVGLTKDEIRELSKALGLPTWNKQSFACLASRFPYGETITEEKLAMIGKAEQYLLDLGFSQLRVRIQDTSARIELKEEEFPKMMDEAIRKQVYEKLQSYGFAYVSLDLIGYRTGSMNEALEQKEMEKIIKL